MTVGPQERVGAAPLAAPRLQGAGVADVMWSLEGPKYNVMSNTSDMLRGEMAGYNARVVGSVRELFPRLARSDYELIKLTQLPEVAGGMQALLDGMTFMSDESKLKVGVARKVAVQQLQDGTKRYLVVPAAPEIMTEVQVLDQEQGYNELAGYTLPTAEQLASRLKKKTYTLDQLFVDSDASNKYEFPLRVLETARRMSVTNPPAAAKSLQDFMNAQQNVIAVTVTAPKGQRNKSLAANTLRTVGAQYDRVDMSVLCEMSLDTLFVYGPGGKDDWHVRGPLKYAAEISYVYWMMFHEGRIFPNVLFSMELVLLGIDVYDGNTSEEPEIVFHSGVSAQLPVGLSQLTTLELSVAQRMTMESFSDRMTAVMSSQGAQIATAVQVTQRHAIINAHVMMADPDCTIRGAPLSVKKMLARDVVCVATNGDSPPWVMRTPKVSEWVVICYLVAGQLSCTQPIQIVSVTNEEMVLTMDRAVGPGFSGGAVVALADLALMGIHSGATQHNLLAYRFGDSQFADLLDSDSIAAAGLAEDADEFAEKTLDYIRHRGLEGVFDAAVSSLESVHVGEAHVGTAVRMAGRIYTTCDPSQHLTFGDGKVAHVLDREPKSRMYSARDETRVATPVYRRLPNYYERVFIIGFDGEPYLSTSTEVAHIALGHASFVLRDLPEANRPLTGGLVMAFDGAFLGLCGPRAIDTPIGAGMVCWPVGNDRAEGDGTRGALAKAFPFLSLAAWHDELIEEVFTHSSVGRYDSGRAFNAGSRPLALLGDAVVKHLLWIKYRQSGVPVASWQTRRQELQSQARIAEAAWTHGIARSMIVGPGSSFPRDARAYAELTLALIGAASLVEHHEILNQLVDSIGLVDDPGKSLPSPARTYFELPRSNTMVRMLSPGTPAVD